MKSPDNLIEFTLPEGIQIDKLETLPANLNAATSPSSRVDPQILHVLNRLGFGPSPGDIQAVSAMGLERYIQQQLNPGSIALPGWLTQNIAQSRTLNKGAYSLYQRNHPRNVRLLKLRKQERQGFQKKGKGAKQARQQQRKALVKRVLQQRQRENREEQRKIQQQVQLPLMEASNARLIRAINSPRQLNEVMVNFWFNHFNVSKSKGLGRTWVGIYDEQAIRPHVMGSFRTLLGAVAHHPAMLFYLDNQRSKAGAINENYARELLELHTLGVDGGYTLKDIQEVARVFTGWKHVPLTPRQNRPRPQTTNPQYRDFYFDAKSHDSGSKTILGRTFQGNGVNEGEQVLDFLAQHPSTARYISFKLAQYFVADTPPESLVTSLSKTFLSSQGNISSVLASLFSSSEFWDSSYFNKKFKTPYEYIVSSFRATGQTTIDTRQVLGMLKQLGMPLYGRETPDGYPNVQSAWLSPEAMLRRLSLTRAIVMRNSGESSGPVNPNQLAQTLGYPFSAQTMEVLRQSPPRLQATAMLGSPELMVR